MALKNVAAFNWDRLLSKAQSPEVKRTINLLRAKTNEIVATSGKLGEAEKIDFGGYKKKLRFTATAVDALEAAYQKRSLPTYDATLPAFESKKREMMVSVAARIANAAKQDIVDLQKQLENLETTKITKETTYAELCDRFPEIAREIEQEINLHAWAGVEVKK